MEENYYHAPIVWVVALIIIAAGLGFTLAHQTGPTPPHAAPWAAAPVPTLQPTAAIVVPTPAPAPLIAIEDSPGASVTYAPQTTHVDVRVCILAECP